MNFIDLRLKLRHFLKKNGRIVITVLSIWGIIILINYILKNRVVEPKPSTTYEPHVSVMSDSSSPPKGFHKPIENLISEYINCCNNQEYEKAFNLISKECREYEFENNPSKFLSYVLTKIPNKREYSIQNYSNVTVGNRRVYIYDIKYTVDMLATGLTDMDYTYTTEKMAFYRDDNENIKMSIGNYIYHTPIQSISENDYLKIDVLSKTVKYSQEVYEVKFTNRSENTVVISDGYGDLETVLQLPQEIRKIASDLNIVLNPGQSKTEVLYFQKFVDDGDVSQSLKFGSIRVMEKYSGTENIAEEVIQSEIDNALAKFSMTVSVKER